MPADKSVSFREQLQSNVMDALGQVGVNCVHTARLIVGLASQLAAYAEEGVPLAPAVFICNSASKMMGMMGPGEHVNLSGQLPSGTAASKILKAAAYLSAGHWNIYVERAADGTECRFGIFCGSTDPSSATAGEVLFAATDPGFPIIRIRQIAKNKVEVKTSDGSSIEFRFNDDENIAVVGSDAQFSSLAAIATSGITKPSVEFVNFMSRILIEAVQKSHGTLIAVIAKADDIPEALIDAIVIDPPIDLHERYSAHLGESKTADTLSRVQSAASLLSGFVGSDGIAILDDEARIRAYRSFIKSEGDGRPADGGARTRAYGALKGYLGTGVKAAYFRSQDGRMELALIGNPDVE